ncbi:class I SAM-dependent methyltransferase [Sphaerisporangium sp. NPDC005288]|uniref:class I SAM-dependent methyltransferase n=1 Tax=Sphaerisporangium sp. NPDC005288 TaxID=3155114 RepID=UPI0033A402AD
MEKYDNDFYEKWLPLVQSSARVIVPVIIDLVHPRSVIDVGCGIGGWLEEFLRQGITDVLGMDGEWVDPALLRIPKQKFRAADLSNLGEPSRRYDLALCLEVAEHLDDAAGRKLVTFLAGSAEFVAFSAAVPGQGGPGHINEQWLDYWIEAFAEHDYRIFDPIRTLVWDDRSVAPWYAQNLVFFTGRKSDDAAVQQLAEGHSKNAIPVRAVHPVVARWGLGRQG